MCLIVFSVFKVLGGGMFYYVDESGNTGLQLFDSAQPNLFYGVLSSSNDLDDVAELHVKILRERLGVERLHAAELGVGPLLEICESLKVINRKNSIRMDFYRVGKLDHAVINFFDQVFDQGMNSAVPWAYYWTPLRYPLLLKLAGHFDVELIKKAWGARICQQPERATNDFVEVCLELLRRVKFEPDQKIKKVLNDSLTWAAKNPDRIGYNVTSRKSALDISPNVIGFQFVMHGIAARVEEEGRGAVKIVVDRQGEFNRSQELLAKFYADTKEVSWVVGPGLPVMDLKNMPEIPISCTPGDSSAGLELVDIYLWLFKRCFDGRDVPGALRGIIDGLLKESRTDEISLSGIKRRWAIE